MSINIVPINDWIDHTSGTMCPCHPIIQIQCDRDGQPIEKSAIIIHRIVDPEHRERSISPEQLRSVRIKLIQSHVRFLILLSGVILYSLWRVWHG